MDKDILKNQEAFLKAQQDIKDQIAEEIETIVMQSLEKNSMINESAKNVLNLDPDMSGTFQRSEDENDLVTQTIKIIEQILTMVDPMLKMVAWECQYEAIRANMMLLPTEVWDRLFADPTIGPTLSGYVKMPKAFYYDENRHRFVVTPPKDPFNDANPL